jgi:trehalose-6-phosphate hydrolase
MRELENGRNEISEEASGFSREKEMGTVAMEVTNYSGETTDLKKIACMEVYPFSFEDKNSEGNVFGRMKEFLPYWKNLGINTIWLAPVYPSPRKDMGYDIADYEAIDERFGTMEEFDSFVSEVHNLGQKVLMDLVLNHTSTEHEWFKKALAGEEKYQKYYMFVDGEPDSPPTNWVSKFGGNAWEYVPKLKKWYLHLFDVTQADLNWENPNVREELKNIVRFWKEKGVSGFRFDVINLISKPEILENDFEGDGRRF